MCSWNFYYVGISILFLPTAEGSDLHIRCWSNVTIHDSPITLLENGQMVMDSRLREKPQVTSYGGTAKDYILSNVTRQDSQRTLVCSRAGILSAPRSIEVFCKKLYSIHRVLNS